MASNQVSEISTTTQTNENTPRKYIKVKREKSTSKKGWYVDNDDLLATVIADKKTGVCSDKLARYLLLIAERYSYSPSFVHYSYREDMVQLAALNLSKNWHKFDETRFSNPFAFYTTAVYRSFLNFLEVEKEERNIRDALLVEAGANPSYSYQGGRDSGGYSSDDTAFFSQANYDWSSLI